MLLRRTPTGRGQRNDFGPDYYAAATYHGLPNSERTMVGWMNNWAYANDIPTRTWRSAMSIPSTLALETINNKVRLVQQPVSSVSTLYTAAL
ncbi:glycosyl hydrolase [Lipomyces doorenjongii]